MTIRSGTKNRDRADSVSASRSASQLYKLQLPGSLMPCNPQSLTCVSGFYLMHVSNLQTYKRINNLEYIKVGNDAHNSLFCHEGQPTNSGILVAYVG